MKRLFDIFFSFLGLLLLSPLLLALAIAVRSSGRGGVFFRQTRVGLNGRNFRILKFRTMRPDSEAGGQITVGSRDPRVTAVGHFLRSYKLDELPQLWNILIGDMSFVGPRPEVPRYVSMYTKEQRGVLSVRPGLTDYASLAYFDESSILGAADDPEKEYIENLMPAKLKLNLMYIKEKGLLTDLGLILRTLMRVLK